MMYNVKCRIRFESAQFSERGIYSVGPTEFILLNVDATILPCYLVYKPQRRQRKQILELEATAPEDWNAGFSDWESNQFGSPGTSYIKAKTLSLNVVPLQSCYILDAI